MEKVRDMFQSVISKIIDAKVDVRIAHIPGEKNVFADALSRGSCQKITEMIPGAKISPFEPFKTLPEGGFPSNLNRHVVSLPKRISESHIGSRC